jgi:hypothetical protein
MYFFKLIDLIKDFHLPQVPSWPKYAGNTTFGMACFRQIDATDLIEKTDDITRTKVQKAVVILSREPILPSIKNKLGLLTQAFFNQRDFSKTDLINVISFHCISYS